jgi:hypothetical protein
MRNLIRVGGEHGLLRYGEVLEHFEQHFQLAFPRMHRLIAIRGGAQGWPAGTAADFFRDYLAEVQQLAGVIDRLASGTPSADDRPA